MSLPKELNYNAFLESVSNSKVVAITAPAYGDGDSVGTQCALKQIFENLFPSVKCRIINETPCPTRYRFLKETNHFEVSSEVLNGPAEGRPDHMIVVDGNFERIGKDTTKLWNACSRKTQVDHHAMSGDYKYDFRLYDPTAAATTELVFRLIKDAKVTLTRDIAQAIYVGLIFDTGLFKHSNATPEILRIGAELMETGFDHTTTAEKGMLIRNPQAFKLLQALLREANFDVNDRYVWSVLDYETFQSTGAVSDDREGLIDQLFLTDKCEIAAFYFEAEPRIWKVSFRARKDWDVAQLARSLNPEGGGHTKAAGCTLKGSTAEVTAVGHAAIKKLLV
ncbi:hypothetical protein GW916_06465 [bacterium]|nr:hypothetical protein [bacterium]